METPPKPTLIRASELGQYSFCRRVWWLETVKKMRPDNQTRINYGRKVHTHHEHQVRAVIRWRRAGLLLVGLGSLFFTALLLWAWLGA